MNDIVQYLLAPYASYTQTQIAIESLAAVFGVISVLLAQRRHIGVFGTGIVSTVLYTYLFFRWGMYGETIINAYYTAMSLYGWMLWYKQAEADHVHVQVTWADKHDWMWSAVVWVLSFAFVLCVYYFRPWIQDGFGDAGWQQIGVHHFGWVDYLDAALAAIFFIGMWFQAQRKIDSWTMWIIGDVVMVPLMLYKGYGITSLQYAIFVSRENSRGLASHLSCRHIHQFLDDLLSCTSKVKASPLKPTATIFKQKKRCISSVF